MAAEQALSETDYERIESAVMESARGRWFLAEYSRRRGFEGINELMAAMRRIETAIREHPAPPLPYPPYEGIGNRPAVRPALPPRDAEKRAEAIAQLSEIRAGLRSMLPQESQPSEEEQPGDLIIDARHLRFFIEDEELFAPPAKPRSGLPVVASPAETLKDRKRIIVVRRASSRDTLIPLADERGGGDDK